MHVFELTFAPHSTTSADDAEQAVDSLLGAWRKNGQVLGHEFPSARVTDGYRAFVRGPASNALETANDNVYARERRRNVAALGTLRIGRIGRETLSVAECPGHGGSELILYTDYISVESPLRCAECFGTVPVYTLPPRHDHEHLDIVSWQGDYRACDRLQMGCETGEEFALNEMENPESSLSLRGREICRRIRETTGRRTWYYLYRCFATDLQAEGARRCPVCDGEWRLREKWHQLFDFRCERCGLLSSIAHLLDPAEDDELGAADANGGVGV